MLEREITCQFESHRCALLQTELIREYYRRPGVYAGFRGLVNVLESCAEVCELGSALISEGVGVGGETSSSAAEICEYTAALMERVEPSEELARQVIAACRAAARSYRDLVP